MRDDFARFVAAMLGAVGLEYVPPAERVRDQWKWYFRPLSMDEHYMDDHGTIHRKDRKRDKTITARQWKRLKKAARRAVRQREQEACTQAKS